MAIYFHASHEQFAPSALLKYVQLAEQHGFDGVNSSDHFHPWSARQGESGFSFAWLGAAMQASSLPFSMVCAPGQRYHPAIVAQAISTLAEMFPNRLSVALGSGEALNEHITGEIWPDKSTRNQRLKVCYQIIKALLNGEEVNHDGTVVVKDAKLYTLPPERPCLSGAAVSVATAEWLGSWADGLLTVARPIEQLQEVVSAFRDNGGKDKPMAVKVQLAYADTQGRALYDAHDQWRTNIFHESVLGDLSSVAQFDALGEMVSTEDVGKAVLISADLEQHVAWIRQYVDMGFDRIILHQVTRDQELFIREFGKYVLPKLR